MTSNWLTESRHSHVEMMLEDLVRSPSVLPGFRVVNILSIGENLTLSRVERPDKDDFMFAPSAVGSVESIVQSLFVGDAKLEGDSLFREPKGL